MRGKKTHSRDKAKVIEAKLNDPEMSLRDIEKETGIDHNSVWRTINEVPSLIETSWNKGRQMIEKLHSIVDDIINIQKKSLKTFSQMADEWELSTKEVKDLSDIGKTNRERAQVLEWKPTDISKIDFNLEGKSIKELEELRKSILQSKIR